MGLTWTPDLAVGVKDIDDQHKQLFAAMDRLAAAVRAKDDRGIKATLAFLGKYVETHFAGEEFHMRRLSYPGTAGHVEAHRAFVAEFVALKTAYEQQGAVPSVVMKMNNYLFEWLNQHIRKVDTAFGKFLQTRGQADVKIAAPPVKTSPTR